MKKIKLFVFALLAMFVAAVCVSAEELKLQLPEDVSGSDTYVDSEGPVIDADAGNKNVTITYKTGSFKIVNADSQLGRPIEAAYPGIKVYAPEGYNYSNVNDDCGPLYYDGSGKKSCFKKTEDTHDKNDFSENNKHFLLNFVALTKNFLETAVQKEAVIAYYLKFDWDADGTIDQNFTIIIDPTNITLKDLDGENELWNHEIYQEEVAEVMDDVYDDLEATVSVAKGYDFSKYTNESLKALEEAITEAEYALANRNLTTNNQTAIRALRSAITTAIVNLVQKGDEPVKPGSNNPSNTDEKAPNTFDAGLVYMGLALSAIGTSIVSVKKLKNN